MTNNAGVEVMITMAVDGSVAAEALAKITNSSKITHGTATSTSG
jgi:hypothetical protein